MTCPRCGYEACVCLRKRIQKILDHWAREEELSCGEQTYSQEMAIKDILKEVGK